MTDRLLPQSMRARLIISFLVITSVPLLVFGLLVYWQRARFIKEEALRKLEAVRDLKVQTIDRWMDDVINDAQDLSADTLRDLVPPGQAGLRTDPAALQVAREGLENYVRFHPTVTEVQILDPRTATVLLATGRSHEKEDRSASADLIEPLKYRTLFIHDIHASPITKARRMAFALPMLVAGKEGVAGVLVADVDLGVLGRILQERTGMGETGETLIVNRDGIALNELRWKENAPLRLKIATAQVNLATKGWSGGLEASDYRGVEVMAAYAFIPRTGWGFVAKQDLAELYEPIQVMKRTMVLLFGATLALVTLLAVITARFFSEPVHRMRKVADAIRGGDLGARNRMDGQDELGLLAQAFDGMADEVEREITVQKGNRAIVQAMVRPSGVDEFCRELLPVIMRETRSDMGAFFLAAPDGRLVPAASIGLSGGALEPFDAGRFEGAVGGALSSREISIVKVPDGTCFTFRTLAGTAVPRQMLTIPIVVKDRLLAVIALASLGEYPPEAVSIVKSTVVAFGIGFANLLSGEEVRRQAEELSKKNAELEAQSAEMQAQAVEVQQQSAVLKEQNAELEVQAIRVAEANRLKSEFLSNMSHELRTPLNSVMALSRVLRMQGGERLTPEEGEYLEIIERNGKQLLTLINDILDLAKIESGKAEISREDVSMKRSLGAVVESLEPVAREKGIDLSLDVEEGLTRFYSDGRRVHQILQNIVGNAVKFTRKGQVKITARRKGSEVTVAVVDSGIGIPEKELPHLFEEFRQVDGSTSRSFEGTGLGLAIAAKSARLLGGRIDVESAPGVGSTFTVTLPADAPPPPSPFTPVSPDVPVAPFPARGGRLLLVEDSEPAIVQIRMVLESSGYAVDVARGGKAALELMRERAPDGIILDLMMPEVDGFAVLQRMRGTPATALTPVLILTAKDLTPEDLGRLTAGNVHQLVQKGDVDRQELLAQVERLLRKEQAPSEDRAQAEVEGERRHASRPAGGTRPAILIMEDNRDNVAAIRAILDGRYVLHVAGDGLEGLRLASRHRPDLVLLDISLPGLDGLEVLRRLREHPSTRAIPVVALTAHAMKGDRERLLAAGCDDYLPKPVDVERLVATVERWLGVQAGENG